ncbi:MAG: S8 family serine peptidase, partial [Planctomycetota bacterium]
MGSDPAQRRLEKRFRAPFQLESLEARLLLDAGAGLVIGEPAGDEPYTVQWKGQELEAAPGRWIIGLDGLTGSRAEQKTAAEEMWSSTAAEVAADNAALRATASDVEVVRQLGRDGTFLLQVPEAMSQQQVLSLVGEMTGFRFAEPDFLVQTHNTTPDDPMFEQLWGMHNTGQTGGVADADIDAPEAWDLNTGTGDVIVGVIDTGVDYNHPDLAENMWRNPGETPGDGIDNDGNGYVDDVYGWDFHSNNADPYDDHYHGTHVAGTIGAVGNNDYGVAGVSWDAQIMALKFLDAGGSGYTSDAVEAVNYATMMRQDYGVNLVATNNSWGGGGYSQAMFEALQANRDANMLFMAAAGNNYGRNNDYHSHYPSNYEVENVIAVAATDHRDALASFSNMGPTTVDLAAPGVDVVSCSPGEGWRSLNGTSMATPHVTGMAALAWDVHPGAEYTEIRDALFAGVDPVDSLDGQTVTGGRLNAYNTLEQLGLRVSGSNPAPGQVVDSALRAVTVKLSSDVDESSVDPADLSVNDTPAEAVTVIDARTLLFQYESSPIQQEGEQTMSMAAGALERASDGRDLEAWDAVFRYDAHSMEVTESDPADGSQVTLPLTTVALSFSEDVDPNSLDTDDLTLSQGSVTAVELVDSDTVRYTLGGIRREEPLTVDLAEGAVADSYGNPLPSAHQVTYELDIGTVALPTPAVAAGPAGTLVYDTRGEGWLTDGEDIDRFTLETEADQTLTVVLTPAGDLQGRIELHDPNGQLLASADASAAGEEIYIQAEPATAGGTYTVHVTGAGDTAGEYGVRVLLNAALENEANGGDRNDTIDGAQDLTDAFIDVGGGARAAVFGSADSPMFRESQTQTGNFYGSNALTFTFAGDGAPSGGATLRLRARGDLGGWREYAEIEIDDVLTQRVLEGGLEDGYYRDTVELTPAQAEQMLAEGEAVITVRPSWYVGDTPDNELTVELEYPLPKTDDFYRVDLTEGESLSAVAHQLQSRGTQQVGLYDADGELLGRSTSGQSHDQHALLDFVAPADGAYYLSVVGDGNYLLTVGRQMGLAAEPNGDLVEAQPIGTSGETLGGLTGLVGSSHSVQDTIR